MQKQILLAVLFVLLQFVTAVQSVCAGESEKVQLTLVGFAVAKPATAKLIVAFQEEWKAAHNGQVVSFKESYGASGAQTRAILGGLEADVLIQNLSTLIDPLVEKGFVSDQWSKRLPNNSVPATSVMVIAVRPGNPKGIKAWADLLKPGVGVVAINPQTAGNARWGILAGYGVAVKAGGAQAGKDYVFGLVKNTATLVNSGREATDTFLKSQVGDALITFENETIFSKAMAGADALDYIVPDPNIVVEYPVTIVDKYVDKHGTRAVAEAFTKFLFTAKAQAIYAKAGYRVADASAQESVKAQFPDVKRYTVEELGGWKEIQAKLFATGGLYDEAQNSGAK